MAWAAGATAAEAAVIVAMAAFAEGIYSGAGLGNALIAGVSAAALTYVGGQQFGNGLDIGFNAPTFAAVAKVGTVGGAASMLQGGKFGHGFVSAGLGPVGGKAVGGALGGIIGNESVRRVVSSSIVGGTLSSMTGGKFANGAASTTFASLFSELAQGAQEKEPPGRGLTSDEITEAQKVFGDKIDYSQVRIIDGKFVPWQGDGYVIAPDGNIYWPGECGNLASCGGLRTAGVFVHEMTHVLQVQHGVNVLGRGLLLQAGKFLSGGLYDPYKFTYDPGRSFSSYNIEQQGDYAIDIYFGRLPNNIDH